MFFSNKGLHRAFQSESQTKATNQEKRNKDDDDLAESFKEKMQLFPGISGTNPGCKSDANLDAKVRKQVNMASCASISSHSAANS